MSQRGILRIQVGGRAAFWCPGCKEYHGIRIEGAGAWGFNGNYDAPTFTPSVLVEGTRFTEKGEKEYQAWIAAGAKSPAPEFERMAERCHSFVTDGRIKFLGDCTHALRDQTVQLTAESESV